MPTTWNSGDILNGTLSNGNLTVTATGGGGVRATGPFKTTGKLYFEVTATTFNNTNAAIGVANPSASLSGMGPTPLNVAVVYQTGNIYVNNSAVGTVGGAGNVFGIALDLGGALIWFRWGISGSWNATSGTANNPATGTGGKSVSSITTGGLVPAFANGGSGQQVTANFGATAFGGVVPAGFIAWDGVAAGTTQARVMVMA